MKMKTDIIWPESILKATPEALQRIADSKLVARNLRDAFPHPYTLDDAVAFLDNVRLGKMGIVYGMFLNSGELVGVISLTPGRDVNRYSAEVGYFVGEQYWNRGYATEALMLVVNFAQYRHGFKRLFAKVFDFNLASMRVLEKAGFKKEGIMKSSAVKDDKVIDEHLYGLVLGKSDIEILGRCL
jgi:RimJ/RimL family protein N-acetyltransferase